jgi:hypothetical protein
MSMTSLMNGVASSRWGRLLLIVTVARRRIGTPPASSRRAISSLHVTTHCACLLVT